MTRLAESLARIVDGMPPGSAVTLSADWLRAQLEAVREIHEAPLAHLTVKQLAEETGRSVSTVRGWLAEQLIPGAYKLRGREWRVPRAGLREFLEHQARTKREVRPALGRKGGAGLGSWRKLRGSAAEPANK